VQRLQGVRAALHEAGVDVRDRAGPP